MIMANYTFHAFQHNIKAEQGFCAAIGFFDGVHRGHQFLIEQVKEEAKKRGLQPIVISFEEHPRLALSQVRYWPELLTTNEQKLDLLRHTGIAGCVMLHFNHDMSMLTSSEFMSIILHKQLNVRCLIVGYDHHFGSDLSSGYKDYVKEGKNIGIEIIREQKFSDNELHISSSATRRFLIGGNVEMAKACLGRPYTIEGTIVKGRHEGTLLGYPTANLQPECEEQLIPGRGVYAVRAYMDGFSYMGMLNIGWRPTLNNGSDQTIETHLLDYKTDDDLYGKHMKICFCRRVRDEHRFESTEELKRQLAIDEQTVRAMLSEETE